MQNTHDAQRKLYVGMHDGVCALMSTDAGKTWQQGQVTPLAHAAGRLSTSATAPQRAYLAAYEAGVYRTDDGGLTWRHRASYPSDYAHSVLVHPQDAQTVYVGSEPATVFCSHDGGESWQEYVGFRAVPEFFFSSRRRHTRFDCDWSSDVCSSDLVRDVLAVEHDRVGRQPRAHQTRAHDREVRDIPVHIRELTAQRRLDAGAGARRAPRTACRRWGRDRVEGQEIGRGSCRGRV